MKIYSPVLTLLLVVGAQFSVMSEVIAQQPPKPPLPSTREPYKRPEAAPEGFFLPDGTVVKLKFIEDISSKTAKEQAIVDFEVAESIYIDRKAVILAGSPAKGIVIKAKKARMLGRKGKLDIALKELTLASGERVSLRASAEEGGGLSVSTIALSALLTPLFLLMRGKNVNIEAGTEF